MLALALACFVLGSAPVVQSPVTTATAAALVDTRQAVAITGTTELSRAEAFGAAHSAAIDHLRGRWTERGQRVLAEQRPFWLPAVFAQTAVDRWLSHQSFEQVLQIVDREDKVREHDFGQSFQTTLWVAEDPRQVAGSDRQLRRELQQVQRRTLAVSGGTVVFWAVMAFALGWLDRLSRGYMTGRLRLIGLLLGTAVPTLAFLL
jgi:hypothetical protein